MISGAKGPSNSSCVCVCIFIAFYCDSRLLDGFVNQPLEHMQAAVDAHAFFFFHYCDANFSIFSFFRFRTIDVRNDPCLMTSRDTLDPKAIQFLEAIFRPSGWKFHQNFPTVFPSPRVGKLFTNSSAESRRLVWEVSTRSRLAFIPKASAKTFSSYLNRWSPYRARCI